MPRPPLSLFVRLAIGTSMGIGLTSILFTPSTWWAQKQQLKKGEEEIKRLREALSNTRVGNKDR
ncbi:hypothetical protein L207DRAFT_580673 [Hyaloscypha variabilis F]|uniref:Uncharacterized protein n=1 Tax=Hyaloscypha variabilis (strain UAMH 11265 / GT02V1 / F) TaxID=1149755 RepID=A0A2J6RU01_HYAVF|nr:hypothetical protein L207DRAFT_580673 [Hyaloscypha variabilis F]